MGGRAECCAAGVVEAVEHCIVAVVAVAEEAERCAVGKAGRYVAALDVGNRWSGLLTPGVGLFPLFVRLEYEELLSILAGNGSDSRFSVEFQAAGFLFWHLPELA